MKSKKSKVIFLIILITLLTSTDYEYEYSPDIEYSYDDDDDYFASYSNGVVYIGSTKYIESIKDIVNKNDILVIDERNTEDPNYKVLNSYRIKSKKERFEIIDILEEYGKYNPSEWNRTTSSLRNEWKIHNLLYALNIRLDRTTDVDFNNEDEELYSSKVLTKIFFN